MKKLLIFISLALLSFIGGFAIGGVAEVIRTENLDRELVCENAHITEGTHQLIITDQFMETLDNSVYQDKNNTLNNINNACIRLNDVLSHVKFKLVLESHEIITNENDIPVYLSNDYLKDNSCVGLCTHELGKNGLLINQTLSFRTWDLLGNRGYQLALHELMHAIGFAHQEKDSVLISGLEKSPTDLTEKDIELLQNYERRFYETN